MATPALAVLAALPRVGEFTFSNNAGRSPATYKRVRATFDRVAKAAGLEDVRLHDLRRTLMTQAALAGVGPHILRDLLGHRDTTMSDRYIRALNAPVKEAREQIGSTIAAMMAGAGAAEVVRAARAAMSVALTSGLQSTAVDCKFA